MANSSGQEPDFHGRVRQIFDEAIQRPESEQSAFVQTACGGDATLLESVGRLLRARASSEQFMQTMPLQTKQIGRYLIRGELGRGAMGVVYDAVDPMIGRRVAVKVIGLNVAGDTGSAENMRDRLFREARSAGRLFHPGIVLILDVGLEGDSAFITMELVEGPSLQTLITSDGPLKPEATIAIVQQIAAALDYAHLQGVVHRDIKPANIMLHNRVTVKVADFGIAKIMSANQATMTGLVMGTPSYMSPEQIEGKSVDGRSDQFSLAVVAYELLTGARPFQADSMASVVHLIVYGARPSVRIAKPLLPEGVDTVLERALNRFPDQRFGTCAEFVVALDAALHRAGLPPAKPPQLEVRPPALDPMPATPPSIPQTPAPPPLPSASALSHPSATPAPAAIAQPATKPSGFPFLLVGGIAAVVLVGLGVAAVMFTSHGKFGFGSGTAASTLAPSQPAIPATIPVSAARTEPPATTPPASSTGADSGAAPAANAAAPLTAEAPAPAPKPAVSDAKPLVPEAKPDVKPELKKVAKVDPPVDAKAKAASASTRALLFYNAAIAKRHDGNQQAAVELFRQAAELGEPSAMVELAESYHTGEGVAQSNPDALRWFRRAAEAGNSGAMVSMGALYLLGDMVPESYDEAAKWFQKAVERQNAAGMYDLGTLYENGKGVPRNMDRAKQLYQQSAALGNVESQRRLVLLRNQK